MGCRAFIILMAIGIGLFSYGWTEWKLSRNASAQPESITLVELQKGPPSNPYRALGDHEPVSEMVIFRGDDKSDNIEYAYYPILTKKELDSVVLGLSKTHNGKTDKITNEEFLKAVPVKVLIKTRVYRTRAQLQATINNDKLPRSDVRGMVVNEIESISGEESEMLKKSFPDFKQSDVIIFEQDRAPSSSLFAFSLMGAGGLVSLLTLVGAAGTRKAQTA